MDLLAQYEKINILTYESGKFRISKIQRYLKSNHLKHTYFELLKYLLSMYLFNMYKVYAKLIS